MTITSWAEVNPGDIITLKKIYNKRPFRVQVTKVEGVTDDSPYAFVVGRRLTMGGRPSRRRTHVGCAPGERTEFVHISYVTAVERSTSPCLTCGQVAVPAQHATPLGHPCRGRTYAPPRILEASEAYSFAVAEYVVRDGNPDDVMTRMHAVSTS